MFTNCKINSFYRAVKTDLKTRLLKKIMEHKNRAQRDMEHTHSAQLPKMPDCNSNEDDDAAESEVVDEDAETAESEVVVASEVVAEDDDQASLRTYVISNLIYVMYIYVIFLYTMHMIYVRIVVYSKYVLQRHLLFQHQTN